jgi:hypothetical protein
MSRGPEQNKEGETVSLPNEIASLRLPWAKTFLKYPSQGEKILLLSTE